MFGLISRQHALALEEENRHLRNRVRSYERISRNSIRAVAQYERRIDRLCRAIAATRRDAASQQRLANRLMDQLLDATGFQGAPLLPAARRALDLDKEDA